MDLETLETEFFDQFAEGEAFEGALPCCKACGQRARLETELEQEASAPATIAFRLDCGIGCAPHTAARCHAVLHRTVTRAVWLANNAAEKLEANQRDPSKPVPHFRRIFGHDPSRPVPWANNQPSGAVIAARYRAVARAFQWPGGRVPHFRCSNDRCSVPRGTVNARAVPPNSIQLCPAFWAITDSFQRAAVVLHEMLHLLYIEFILHDENERRRNNAHCLEALALLLAGKAADQSDIRQCSGPPPLGRPA
jgi:hypothetical protein